MALLKRGSGEQRTKAFIKRRSGKQRAKARVFKWEPESLSHAQAHNVVVHYPEELFSIKTIRYL